MKPTVLVFLTATLTTTLFFSSISMAGNFQDRTAACRLEIKIMGPDLLDEDKDCIWVEDHKAEIMAKCKECMADFALIKEASRGDFDY